MKLKTNLAIFKIRDESDSKEKFTRAVKYYQENRVKHPRLFEAFGKEIISAEVKGSENSVYNTKVVLDEDGNIKGYDCTCPAFDTYGPCACKHILALLLYRFYNTDTRDYYDESFAERQVRRNDKVVTDIRIKSLINRYLTDDMVKAENYEAVKVIPKLELYDDTVYLSLTVGKKRQYVIRNIESFCKNIKMSANVEYGKELAFVHNMNAFDKESKTLVQFVLKKQSEKESFIEGLGGNSYRYGYRYNRYGLDSEKKFLRLTPAAVDELFDILIGMETFIGLYGSKSIASNIIDYTPEFILKLEKDKSSKGFYLHLPDCSYILGEKYLYIHCDDKSHYGKANEITKTLCRCNQDFSVKIRDLVKSLSGAGEKLAISNDDMSSFYSNVLAEFENLITIKGDVDELKKYIPDEFDIKFYVDSPKKDVITTVIKYKYGDKEFDPYLHGISKNGIVRNDKKERKVQMAVAKYFSGYDNENKCLYIKGNDENLYEFVTKGIEEMADMGEVFATDKFKNMGIKRTSQISIGVRLENDLLKIDLDTKELPIDEVMDALKQYNLKKKYYRMKDGSFLKLEDEGFYELSEMMEGLDLSGKDLSNEISVPKYRSLYLDMLLKDSSSISFERSINFKKLIRNFNNIDYSDLLVPKSLDSIMRNYQKYGYQWLMVMDEYGFGGILADDMGLGKTLQMISLILSKKENGENCKTLVVCPASLVLNWKNEIEKFAPLLKAEAVIGNLSERKKFHKNMDEYDVIITSYDLLKRDIEFYKDKEFRYHVIDEAQYIKNHGTQNAKAVKIINSKQRFALTGTPIENRLSELWSIFDFLMPLYLSSYQKFKDTYETDIVKNQDKEKLSQLGKMVSPFMLRRLKNNVLKELPEKVESVIYMQMEGEQKKLYLANLMKTKEELNKNINNNEEINKIAFLAMLTRLRQICCHPALCYDDYKSGSAKLHSCIELIKEAALGGHKVLLFSQFTSMLDLIMQSLKKEGISFYILTGSTPKEKRMEMVEQFNVNDIQVFLISLKAGGTGLNLTGADVVIHYDPWWNVAAQNQATDRTHRIGQKKSVQVYKLIEKGTVEEKILKLQESKKNLADAIVKDDMSGLSGMSKEELLGILEI
ncbi:SNF2-related protein [Anaerovorax odorimutans]|uniref:SNF2-related protein n=1 Tax=Anaerovorax odorimutans TaxID=109327 RepID=UPI0004167D63|nr:SNF2 helicase associated domain-containing protein [Anaerovorax odorimutans]